jgi:anti-sigma factor RsiW
MAINTLPPEDAGRVTDADLHALVDGQLSSARAAEVSEWLAQHPHEAARVLAWQSQRAQLRELHRAVLDEPVPRALQRAAHRRLQAPWPGAMAAGLLLAVGLSLGLGGGWWLRGDAQGDLAAAVSAGQRHGLGGAVPGFVNEAAMAHVVYAPEKRHPVEVGAEQQEHLVQWLSKRLGGPLRVPSLASQGYELVGGRLLPGPQGQARAQFMYERGDGRRLTLFVTALDASAPVEALPAFQFAAVGEGARAAQSFYWIDGRWGYALNADLPRGQLAAIAEALYAQLAAAAR